MATGGATGALGAAGAVAAWTAGLAGVGVAVGLPFARLGLLFSTAGLDLDAATFAVEGFEAAALARLLGPWLLRFVLDFELFVMECAQSSSPPGLFRSGLDADNAMAMTRRAIGILGTLWSVPGFQARTRTTLAMPAL
jgi:hypothetical protein